MKKSSRFMPRYEPRKANKPALVVLLLIAVAIVAYQPVYLAIVVGIAFSIIVWGKFEQKKIEEYFSNLCEDRKGV